MLDRRGFKFDTIKEISLQLMKKEINFQLIVKRKKLSVCPTPPEVIYAQIPLVTLLLQIKV